MLACILKGMLRIFCSVNMESPAPPRVSNCFFILCSTMAVYTKNRLSMVWYCVSCPNKHTVVSEIKTQWICQSTPPVQLAPICKNLVHCLEQEPGSLAMHTCLNTHTHSHTIPHTHGWYVLVFKHRGMLMWTRFIKMSYHILIGYSVVARLHLICVSHECRCASQANSQSRIFPLSHTYTLAHTLSHTLTH